MSFTFQIKFKVFEVIRINKLSLILEQLNSDQSYVLY